MASNRPTRLVVFADDWGRHPSSAQHLVRELLPKVPTVWVNTIGTRPVQLNASDLMRGLKKMAGWLGVDGDRRVQGGSPLPGPLPVGEGDQREVNLEIISPLMWPGFRQGWQRVINRRMMIDKLTDALASDADEYSETIGVTTLPITAEVVGEVPGVDRWVYYCVDDFSVWPGVDGAVMADMEAELVQRVDGVIAVSENLRTKLRDKRRDDVSLLTHGIDLRHWGRVAELRENRVDENSKPVALFWGLIDSRLDEVWCHELAEAGFTVRLVGPRAADGVVPEGCEWIGPRDYEDLPGEAAKADVLVMPYRDLAVTRAMQPLKFKEYLATGLPVVGRALPGVSAWGDAADLVEDVESFVAACHERVTQKGLATGLPAWQVEARERLIDESWTRKAETFFNLITGNEDRLVIRHAA